MFVLTPRPCVLVCVRVCVRASSVNRVNCIGHYPSREPAQKRSRLCCFLPQPRVQEHNSEHERWDSRLLLFELYKQANCEAKRPFFSFFYFSLTIRLRTPSLFPSSWVSYIMIHLHPSTIFPFSSFWSYSTFRRKRIPFAITVKLVKIKASLERPS